MTRRDFLALAAGGTIALAIPSRLSALVPSSAPLRTWTWVKATGFKPAQDFPLWIGQLIGQRSDGEWFSVLIPVTDDQFRPEVIDGSLHHARLTLETFLDCACRVDHPCAEHRDGPTDGSEAGQDDAVS